MQPFRRLVLALSVIAFCCSNAGAEGVSFNVYYRVLMIQTSNGQGTGFTIDIDGRQYLIRAKHMVTGLQPEDTIELRKYDASHQLKWVDLKMKIFKCDDPVDIAVLVPQEQLTAAVGPMDPTSSVMFGQDVFFVGFPFGMSNVALVTTFQMTSPFGYVKKAVVSGITVTKIGETVNSEFA
jgi:hypothetical protein